jgi:hypothetical protein
MLREGPARLPRAVRELEGRLGGGEVRFGLVVVEIAGYLTACAANRE